MGTCDLLRPSSLIGLISSFASDPVDLKLGLSKQTFETKLTFSVSQAAGLHGPPKKRVRCFWSFSNSLREPHVDCGSFTERCLASSGSAKHNYYEYHVYQVNILCPSSPVEHPLFSRLDAAAARYLFDNDIDPARQPKVAALIRKLKINSGNDISAFEGALSGLEGAHRTLENGVLQTTHQLIGPSSLEHDMYQPWSRRQTGNDSCRDIDQWRFKAAGRTESSATELRVDSGYLGPRPRD